MLINLTHHICKKLISLKPSLSLIFGSSENFVKLLEKFLPFTKVQVLIFLRATLWLARDRSVRWLNTLAHSSLLVQCLCGSSFTPKAGVWLGSLTSLWNLLGGLWKKTHSCSHLARLKFFTGQDYFKIHVINCRMVEIQGSSSAWSCQEQGFFPLFCKWRTKPVTSPPPRGKGKRRRAKPTSSSLNYTKW